jgi:hypothetical protein
MSGETTSAQGPRRFDFHGLSDDAFEELCFLVVLLEHPEAIRLRAPDNGADAALPEGANRRYTRCWQAKRFGNQIQWHQCRHSLDTALGAYAPRRYTFCFANDLTGKQEERFNHHLAARHPGVTVDWWGASKLTATLIATDQGERIARRYIDSPDVIAQAIAQAIRAGGPLETGADAFERMRAAAEWLAGRDPYYSYLTSQHEPTIAEPALHPGGIISVERVGSDVVERIQAIPRNPNAIQGRLPGGVIHFDNTDAGQAALDQVNRAFEGEDEVTIDRGVRVEFRNLPEAIVEFAGNDEPEQVSIRIAPGRRPKLMPWQATLAATSTRGDARFDVDLLPVSPSAGWEAEYSGVRFGLRVAVRFRRAAEGATANLEWTYTEEPSRSAAEKRDVIMLLLTLHGAGHLDVIDRSRQRPTLPIDLQERPVPPAMEGWSLFLGDLTVIEQAVGHRIDVPDEIPPDAAGVVRELAYILRAGASRMMVDRMEIVQTPEARAAFQRATGPLRITTDLDAELFGERLHFGTLVGDIHDWTVVETLADPESDRVVVAVAPTSDASRHPAFRLLRP